MSIMLIITGSVASGVVIAALIYAISPKAHHLAVLAGTAGGIGVGAILVLFNI